MGNEEDIARLRSDISDLYDQCRDFGVRVTRLEERSDNRDTRLEELKVTIKELESMVQTSLSDLSAKIQTLINAPAQKVAGRWDEIVKIVLAVGATAIVTYALSRLGIK